MYIYIYIYKGTPASEGVMIRLTTLIELNFLDSSCSSLSSCRN